MTHDQLELVVQALEAAGCQPRRQGTGYAARCPAHEDGNPSLSVNPGDRQPVVLTCHAGCATDDILAALGLKPADLCEEDRPRAVEVARYRYVDADGTRLYDAVRYEPGFDGERKTFRQFKPDQTRGGLNGTRRVLYQLPEVLAAAAAGLVVWVAEGEKDVHALERAGVVATCNPMGAGKWRNEYGAALVGAAEVVIVADKDKPGALHAVDVLNSATAHEVPARIVTAATGKDPADHLAAGHGLEDFVATTAGALLAAYVDAPSDQAVTVTRDAGPELPAGYELWTGADRPGRPEVSPGIFHGPIGEFARKAAEHTEADPVAILVQGLAAFGVAAHRGPHVVAGNDRHAGALFALIVGRSAKARKGTSWAPVRDLIQRADAGLVPDRILSGFGSGEALIAELAPPGKGDDAATAARDTRALVLEAEFGEVLARARREGSTTSPILRNAWDGRPLQNRTRGTGRLVATDYHLGAVGHITTAELRAKLTDTDVYGGFLNRWLPVYVERSRLLPDGGNVPDALLDQYGRQLRDALKAARGAGMVKRDAEAGELWRDLYAELEADDPPGLMGHVVARGAAQCLRLSLVYCLADGCRTIAADHVGAAYLVWSYARASAALIFGETTGDANADRLLDALREAGAAGLDGTEVRDLFSRHPAKATAARQVLEAYNLAASVTDNGTGGRPRTVTYAVRRSTR